MNDDININIYPRLERSIAKIKEIFGESADVNVVKVYVSGVRCAVVTLEAMVSSADLSKMLFAPLMDFNMKNALPEDVFEFISSQGIFSVEQKLIKTFDDISQKLCSGFAVVLVNGIDKGMAYSAQGFSIKSIEESSTEANVKGTKEALDNLRTSMSLIRRRVKNPLLRFEFVKAGKLSNTELCLVYIEGKTPEKLKKLIRARLKRIKLDLILTTEAFCRLYRKTAELFSPPCQQQSVLMFWRLR